MNHFNMPFVIRLQIILYWNLVFFPYTSYTSFTLSLYMNLGKKKSLFMENICKNHILQEYE